MDGLQVYCSAILLLLTADSLLGDREYFVIDPQQMEVPLMSEAGAECKMNFAPDKFEWKFYPLGEKDAYNPKAMINLATANYTLIPHDRYTSTKIRSTLIIKANSTESAGDYQCLAHYGAMVVASIPWRITIAHIGKFGDPKNINVEVTEGNTVSWRCEPPPSNPEVIIDYYFNDDYLVMLPEYRRVQNKSLIIEHAHLGNTGRYTCIAYSSVLKYTGPMPYSMDLKVVRNGRYSPPQSLVQSRTAYIVNKGESVLLECAAVGNPVPQRKWYKKNGNIPYERAVDTFGGLKVNNVTASDEGVYICEHTNSHGSISHHITLIYNEEPSIDCPLNSTTVNLQETLFLNCTVKGVPEPQISWLLNGYSVVSDKAIEAIHDRVYFNRIEKRHAGNLQCFATNRVKTVYSRISITVVPLTTNISFPVATTRSRHHHNGRKGGKGSRKQGKHNKRKIPPSKPIITRKDDETVVVRWNVTMVKPSLAIQFFKVQYRELGPASSTEHHKNSKWDTCDEIIPSHARSFEVGNLKPEHYYKFRIAAVYENNEDNAGNVSDKFLLKRLDFEKKNPLPVPTIVSTEPVNSTAVKIYWECPTHNITVSGFYIYYLSANSAGDYDFVTVDGDNVRSFVLNHLLPDTYYDVKMASFGSGYTSLYSQIMKAKTKGKITTITSTIPPVSTNVSANTESAGISQLYIIIAAVVVLGGLLISGIALLFICKRWKEKKNSGDSNKSGVDDHHIQNEANDYIVSPKSMSRANGCVPSNRMTITANPLADADNKTQNMIEMSCLTSQNNNCSIASQPSVSGQVSSSTTDERTRSKVKNRENVKRNKKNSDSTSPLCVYKRD